MMTSSCAASAAKDLARTGKTVGASLHLCHHAQDPSGL